MAQVDKDGRVIRNVEGECRTDGRFHPVEGGNGVRSVASGMERLWSRSSTGVMTRSGAPSVRRCLRTQTDPGHSPRGSRRLEGLARRVDAPIIAVSPSDPERLLRS